MGIGTSVTERNALESRGHLNPGDRAVVFDRFELGDDLAELVRHVWVVRWTVPAGETRAQRMLTYPAFNAIVQPEGTTLAGPDPHVSVVELAGESWAVGVLFRPAAAPLLTEQPVHELVAREVALVGAPEGQIAAAMQAPDDPDSRPDLVQILREWLLPIASRVGEPGRLMNAVGRLAEEDTEMVRSTELAARAGIGVRTLERLVREHVGVSPKWLIECRRLQDAATTLYAQPDTDLSALGASLGFADYPHFSRRYAAILGETPEQTRQNSPHR